MDKALEAAARAIMRVAPLLSSVADQQMVCEYEDLCRAEARAAIRAYLSALREDPEVVERIAGVVAEGFYFGMPQVDPDAVPNGLARDIARAALSAIEVE